MTQSELEQFGVKIKQDYVKLLDLLARLLNRSSPSFTTDLEDRERLSIALGLTDKFVNHAVTVLFLSHGTNLDLPSFKFRFVDSASIDVLARASLEAFLVFHYVFYTHATKKEKDYRYWAYKVAGIVERQNFPASSVEFKQKLSAEIKNLMNSVKG